MGLSQAHHRAHVRQSPSPYMRTRARSRTAPSTSGAAYPPGMSPSPPPAMPPPLGPPFSEPSMRRLGADLNASTASSGSSLDAHSPAALLGPLTSAMDLDASRASGSLDVEGDSPLKGYSTSSVARRPPNEVTINSNGRSSQPPAFNIFSPPPAPQSELAHDASHGPSGYLDYNDLSAAQDASQGGPLLVPSVFQDLGTTGKQHRGQAGSTDVSLGRGEPEHHARTQDESSWTLPPMPATQITERHGGDREDRQTAERPRDQQSRDQQPWEQEQHQREQNPYQRHQLQAPRQYEQRQQGDASRQERHDQHYIERQQDDQRQLYQQEGNVSQEFANGHPAAKTAVRGTIGPKPEPVDPWSRPAFGAALNLPQHYDTSRHTSSRGDMRPTPVTAPSASTSPYPPSFSPPQQGPAPTHYPSYITPDTPALPASASFILPSATQYGTPPNYAIWSPPTRAGEQPAYSYSTPVTTRTSRTSASASTGPAPHTEFFESKRSAYESFHDGLTPWASAEHTPPPRSTQAHAHIQPAHSTIRYPPSMPAPPLQFHVPDSTAHAASTGDARRYGMVGGSGETVEHASSKPVRADQRRKKAERTPAEKEAQARAQRQAAKQPDRFKLPPVNPLVPLGHTHAAAERVNADHRQRHGQLLHASASAELASATPPSVLAHSPLPGHARAHAQAPQRTPYLPPIDSLNLPRQAPRSVGQSSFHTYSPTTHKGENSTHQDRRR